MAPSALPVEENSSYAGVGLGKKPLKSTGSLDGYKHIDSTPVIGTEYPELNIVNDILSSPQADQKLRDLAIKSASRLLLFHSVSDGN